MEPRLIASDRIAAEETLPRTHYRAPREQGGLLCTPSAALTPGLIAVQHEQLQRESTLIWGEPVFRWRTSARRECLDRAVCYSATLDQGSCDRLSAEAPIVATGHQPELFHPGVWAKNFLASQLAESCGGWALNLVVDSDTVKSRSVTVPTFHQGVLRQTRVPLDEWPLGLPWEELQVTQVEQFLSIAERIADVLPPIEGETLLGSFGEALRAGYQHCGHPVASLVAARRQLEQRLGVRTLELPVSQLSQTPTFLRFLAALMVDASRFRQVYNRALQTYRTTYHLKSVTHPIPDLLGEEDWQEIPCWVWTAHNPRRRGLFARLTGKALELSDREGLHCRIPLSSQADHAELPTTSLLPHLTDWLKTGIRLRPRALITTLYTRLFVSDWFIHGIGGARYDEITDEIIRHYFQLVPPRFQVATATEWLPLQQASDSLGVSAPELRRRLRHAEENPELLLDPRDPQVRPLLEHKSELVAAQQARPRVGLSRKERRAHRPVYKQQHEELTRIRRDLAQLANSQLVRLRAELAQTERAAVIDQVAHFREYPYVCYPEARMQQLLQAFKIARPLQGMTSCLNR